MKPGISLITLGVADLEASIRFYRDGLCLPSGFCCEDIAFFDMSGTWLSLSPRHLLEAESIAAQNEIVKHQTASKKFQRMNSYFTLACNLPSPREVDKVLALAERAGALQVEAGQKAFWGGYVGKFKDPDGFVWELCWNPLISTSYEAINSCQLQ